MSRFVVDASVAVKWFVPEVHHRAALRLLDGSHEWLAPDLLLPEFGNIIWKKTRRGEITQDEGRQIVRAFRKVPIQIHSSANLLEPAFEIANRMHRSVYDSVYLALAILQRCRMLTADRKFCEALKDSPMAGYLHWFEHEAQG